MYKLDDFKMKLDQEPLNNPNKQQNEKQKQTNIKDLPEFEINKN